MKVFKFQILISNSFLRFYDSQAADAQIAITGVQNQHIRVCVWERQSPTSSKPILPVACQQPEKKKDFQTVIFQKPLRKGFTTR